MLPLFVSYLLILMLKLAQPSWADNPERIGTVRSYKLEFFENGKPYQSARTACEARDAWLVEIKDDEIFAAVNTLKLHYTIWIGAFYLSGWTWNGIDSIRYANWSSGNPTNVEDRFKNHCGMMSGTGQWRNTDCTKTYRYVCQTDLNYPGSFSLTFVTTPKKSFNKAKTACTAMTASSSRLVEIKTSALNAFIYRNISGQAIQYWTSGDDTGREGYWKWGDGNSINKNSVNWIASADGKREPSGASEEDCLATNITGWADELCTKTNGYICQENITSGQCEEEVCSNRGICAISDKRYICSCIAGYFGTKCEKDLIMISLRSTTLHKGQTLTVPLTVKSYDGNVEVFHRREAENATNTRVIIPSFGSSKMVEYSLAIQLQSVIYYFDARPVSNHDSYLTHAILNITVIDHCASSPCMNGGTCNYTISPPYYTCDCQFEYDGLRCEANSPGALMPKNFAVEIKECSANATVFLVPKKKALGMIHRTEIRVIANGSSEIVRSVEKIPDAEIFFTQEFPDLELSTKYHVSITVCPRCAVSYTITRNVSTYGPGLDPELELKGSHPASTMKTCYWPVYTTTAEATTEPTTTTEAYTETSPEATTMPVTEMETTTAVHVELWPTSNTVILLLGILLLVALIGNIAQFFIQRNAKAKFSAKDDKPDNEYGRYVKPYETTFMGSGENPYENEEETARSRKRRNDNETITSNGAYEVMASIPVAQSSSSEFPPPPDIKADSGYEEFRPAK